MSSICISPRSSAVRRRVGLLLLATLALLIGSFAAPQSARAVDGGETPPERYRMAIVDAFWRQVWGKQDVGRIDELFAETFRIHSGAETIGPRPAFKAWVQSFFDNISDVKLDVVDQFASGNMVVTRWRCSGRLTGAMFGLQGSGQEIRFSGISIWRVEGSQIVEGWVERDSLSIIRQLGLVPAP